MTNSEIDTSEDYKADFIGTNYQEDQDVEHDNHYGYYEEELHHDNDSEHNSFCEDEVKSDGSDGHGSFCEEVKSEKAVDPPRHNLQSFGTTNYAPMFLRRIEVLEAKNRSLQAERLSLQPQIVAGVSSLSHLPSGESPRLVTSTEAQIQEVQQGLTAHVTGVTSDLQAELQHLHSEVSNLSFMVRGTY